PSARPLVAPAHHHLRLPSRQVLREEPLCHPLQCPQWIRCCCPRPAEPRSSRSRQIDRRRMPHFRRFQVGRGIRPLKCLGQSCQHQGCSPVRPTLLCNPPVPRRPIKRLRQRRTVV